MKDSVSQRISIIEKNILKKEGLKNDLPSFYSILYSIMAFVMIIIIIILLPYQLYKHILADFVFRNSDLLTNGFIALLFGFNIFFNFIYKKHYLKLKSSTRSDSTYINNSYISRVARIKSPLLYFLVMLTFVSLYLSICFTYSYKEVIPPWTSILVFTLNLWIIILSITFLILAYISIRDNTKVERFLATTTS